MHEGKYRRIEVITGRRQRRNWTDEEKARKQPPSATSKLQTIVSMPERWSLAGCACANSRPVAAPLRHSIHTASRAESERKRDEHPTF
jgi:hypothetical protein